MWGLGCKIGTRRGGVETVYENLRIAWVKAGDEVGQGASLGEVGASSAASDGECIIRFIVLERGGNAIDLSSASASASS